MEDFTGIAAKLAHVALENLTHSGGERQDYWLLAVKAAREAVKLAQVQTAADMPPE